MEHPGALAKGGRLVQDLAAIGQQIFPRPGEI
jgi:hypothetical protein